MVFAGLFSRYWSLLPREVAAPVIRELAARTLEMKAKPGEYTLTENPDDPKLNSDQENELSVLMPALQHFEPDLARSILESSPRVAQALKRFPLGMRSVWEEPNRWKYDPARWPVGTWRPDHPVQPESADLSRGIRPGIWLGPRRYSLPTMQMDTTFKEPLEM